MTEGEGEGVDRTMWLGGALVTALTFGLVLGFLLSPGLGAVGGLAAALAWLGTGTVAQRRRNRRDVDDRSPPRH